MKLSEPDNGIDKQRAYALLSWESLTWSANIWCFPLADSAYVIGQSSYQYVSA